MSQTILLAGASGLIGRSVLERLLEQKFTVIAPTRSTLGVHSSLRVGAITDTQHAWGALESAARNFAGRAR